MHKAHRLDETTYPSNDIATGEEGFVRDPNQRRVKEPDEYYPHLPETNYHHDAQTTKSTRSPGPFHGDDLVSHGVTAPDTRHGGTTVATYVHDNEINIEEADSIHSEEFQEDQAVPVRVVDIVVKERRTTHQILTPVLVAPDTIARIAGKDPTRSRIYVSASNAGAIFVQESVKPSGIATANLPAFGLPVPVNSGGYRMDTEDDIWVYVGSDATISAAVTTTTNVQTSNTFAAAAAGSVSLPNGATITGFDVNFLPAAANVTGIITVTNVAGGTMSYETGIGTGGGGTDVSIRYPFPLPAASAGVAPTVNVPAITGGPIYSITVYGQTTSTTSPGSGVYLSAYFELERSAENRGEYYNG